MGNFTPSVYNIRGFNGNQTKILGFLDTKINFGEFSIKGQVSIIENLNYDFIIGLDLVDSIFVGRGKNKVVNKVEINGVPLKVLSANQVLDQYLCSNTEIVIGPYCAKMVTFDNPGLDKNLLVRLDKHPEGPSFIDIKPTLCYAKSLIGMIENHSCAEITIPEKVPLYSLIPEDKNINNLLKIEDEKSETERYNKFLKERLEKFQPDKNRPTVKFGDQILNDTKKSSEIQELLNKYNLAFSANKHDIGLIKGFRYKVDLKEGAEAWYQPPRRIPPAVKKDLTEQFRNELENDLLCEGNSEYNIPLVIIKKKDGRFRCCLDMRQGNSRIVGTKYPLPDLHAILTEIGEMITTAKNEEIYIASFDMNSAYRQLAIRDNDVQKFAFTFYNDQYSHQLANKRMVFGVEDAPSTFSMLMRTVLSGLKGTWNYLDDIQVCAVGFENLKLQISALFERLIQYGITLEEKKCEIGAKETELLGHLISEKGISLVPDKVDAIKNLPAPKNKDHVRSICGSFAYFIDFVPHLMETISPLYDLLKKNSNFKWSNLHQQAFDKAKHDLAESTLRNHRNLNYKLVIVSDASDVGCGSMLGQINESGKIEPLQYSSKIFADPEKRQPIRMRELYAIFYAIKKWQSILIGEDFMVMSDHKSLEFLQNTATNELSIRQHNILYYLGHFRFQILHVPGRDSKMFTADLLSRAPYFNSGTIREEENEEFEDPTHIFTKSINNFQIFNNLNSDKIASSQAKDDFCINRQDKIGYDVQDGLLYKIGKDKKKKMVLPEDIAYEIAEYCHKCKGHLGSKRLYDFLNETFFAKKFSQICKKVSIDCTDCIAVKYRKKKKGKPIEILDMETKPFSKVYFDLIDLGGTSELGNRYGLTYQCALTRYLDCEPIKDKTAESVSSALLKLFLRYGIPDRAVCDNGKEVINKTNKILYNMLGIYVSNISPLHPNSNLVERSHKQLSELLKIYKIEIEKWDIYMPLIIFYYNTAGTESLNGLTPFEALYLRPSRSPLSLNQKDKLQTNWTEHFGNFAQNIFTDLAKQHKRRFNAQKLYNDEIPTVLRKNQRVLIYKPQPKGFSKKLYRTWDGPYRVQKRTSSNVYLLINISTGKKLKRNLDLIRLLPSDKNFRPSNQNLRPSGPEIVGGGADTESIADQNLQATQNSENQNNFEDNILPDQSNSQNQNNFKDNISPDQINSQNQNNLQNQIAKRGKRERKLPQRLRDYQLN